MMVWGKNRVRVARVRPVGRYRPGSKSPRYRASGRSRNGHGIGRAGHGIRAKMRMSARWHRRADTAKRLQNKVRGGGLEPPRDCSHWILSVVHHHSPTPSLPATCGEKSCPGHDLPQLAVSHRVSVVLYRVVPHGGTYEAPRGIRDSRLATGQGRAPRPRPLGPDLIHSGTARTPRAGAVGSGAELPHPNGRLAPVCRHCDPTKVPAEQRIVTADRWLLRRRRDVPARDAAAG